MPQATLFDAEPDAPAEPLRLPAEPWLVRELVERFDVPEGTARGYSMRQAFAVRARLARAKTLADGGKPSAAAPLPPPLAEPHTLPARAPAPVRAVGADELEKVLAAFAARAAGEDELFRFLRGSLYLLDSSELVRVAKGLIPLLRGS